MKNSVKKILALVLAVVMVFGSIPLSQLTGLDFANLFTTEASAANEYSRTYNFNKNYTLTNNPAENMAIIARKQLWKKGSSFNYPVEWCAAFVSDVAILAGQEKAIPWASYCGTQLNGILNAGGKIINANQRQRGDIVFYKCSVCNYYLHVGIVVLDGGNNIFIDGNLGGSGTTKYTRQVKYRPDVYTGRCHGAPQLIYVRPNYSNPGPAKPNPPVISSTSTGNVPVGTNVVVSWPAVANATGYKVLLNGSYVQTSTATSYNLNVSEAKSYTIKVQAYNSSYSSDVSNAIVVTGKSPSIVTFVDWNGMIIQNPQTVDYGKNAVAPDSPSREGYTFTGWDKSFTSVTTDLTVKATYKIKTFNITFLDTKGNVIGTPQKVNYGDSATPPAVTLETGHVFVGWSSDEYKNVKKDATVQAISKWGNDALPIVTQLTSANRQQDGYYVTFDLTNYPTERTRGRAVITLKTADGKMVFTTESAAFSIPANGVKRDMEVFVPCDKAASIMEVIIVADYSSGVPISEMVSATIDEGQSWSDWSTTRPTDTTLELEEKTQYRFREKAFSTGNTKTKDGWTLDGTRNVSVGSWIDSGTNVVSTVNNESLFREVSTYDIPISKDTWGYVYYHFYRAGGGNHTFCPTNHNGGTYHGVYYSTSPFEWYKYSTCGSKDLYKGYACPDCGATAYWFYNANDSKMITVQDGTKKGYKYRDTTYTYNFWQWKDWSAWQDTPISVTGDMETDTQTLYRYRAEGAGVEDTSGVLRTVDGMLDSSFAGKQITLFVYKIDEASDYTNEAVAQSVIGDDGSYSFTFKLREEPTVKTGDFTVAIGVEGTNNIVVIDTIEAPKATYTVKFLDWDGSLVDTKTVTEGQTVALPENPSREGYTFVGWDDNLTNVKEDLEVTARYIINTYSVILVDWVKQSISIQEYNHGDVISLPEPQSVYGYDFSGWTGLEDEMIATQNLILAANYDAKEYNVKFYDYDGNVVSDQTINYGESSEIPDAPTKDGYIFLGWDYDGNLLEVDKNMTAIPIYVFEETVEAPVASVESGSYDTAQTVTLSCSTEDAVIYYTLDGEDPTDELAGIEYTGPITIDRTVQLKFVASSLGKNDSEIVSEYYAINNENMTSDWIMFDDIPDFVMDNLDTRYTLINSDGYRCKNTVTLSSLASINEFLADGWIEESASYGEWSEWSAIYPEFTDVNYEVEEGDPPPVPTGMYQYTRYKYVDDDGNVYYSHKDLPDADGELETLVSSKILRISGFVSGSRTPIYKNEADGEEWYNQTKVTVDVQPDYKVYRYRTESATLYKWTDWVEGTPSAEETRETESDMIFQYTGFKSHVITLVPMFAEVDYKFFGIADELVDLSGVGYEIEGFTVVGFYTDPEYTNEWDIENDVVTGDMTLYVKYEINSYNVTFKNSDGTTLSTQTIEYGSSATPPEVPVADGNAFVRWDTDAYLSVTGDMIVTAVVKPEDEIVKITLNKDFFIMMEGSMIHLTATVTPDTIESTAVVWSSSDYSIADVDHNGYVTALSAGTVEIKATAIDGTFAVCKLTIEEYTDKSLKLTTDSKYGLDKDNGYLRGVSVNENTADEIKANFRNSKVAIFKNGTELTGTDVVGTGAEVRLMNGETIVETVYVVVTGDATGDGYINNRDASYVTRYVVNKEAPSVVQLVAMDVNGDGNVNNRDASMVARYLVGKETF